MDAYAFLTFHLALTDLITDLDANCPCSTAGC